MFMDESLISQKKQSQKPTPTADDNVSELLLKIIRFTKVRRKLLARNIRNMNIPDFTPRDLPTKEFAEILNLALDEHICRQRLLLCDTENISFGRSGVFEASAVTDNTAKTVLQCDKNKYLQMQINKLMENTLNQKIALALLGQKSKKCPLDESGRW